MIELKKIDIINRTEEWNDFIFKNMSDGFSKCFIGHNPSLANILYSIYGHEIEYYFLEDNGKIIALLPGFRINGKFTSIPLFPVAGLFVLNDADKNFIYNEILNLLKNFEIRDIISFSKYSYDNKVISYLNLENNCDAQFNNFSSDKRNHIRKGYKLGLTVKIGGPELVDEFYSIYSLNMHHLGSPALEKIFFIELVKNYKYGLSNIFICYYNNIPIGGSILLTYFNLAEVSWASTLVEYNKLKPNMVMYWEMIKYSITNGINIFSFGRSTRGGGVHEFKSRWGALDLPIFFNHSGYNFDIRKLKFLSTIWRKLPPALVNKIGPGLRKLSKI